ncbi:zinc-ribbon domain-containing protein [Desulfoluna sp.]|uniref:DUF3426 domain-containing protein n=1 Tax=Desulfoluna sp. TaxID=2045199 RepID=UPI002630BB8E|nr:zinc-ribbon domain-containing protein [Desulfoluna sp.]
MIITCQECDSRFVLDDKLIKPTGSKVRCSSCKHVFKVFAETAPPSFVEPDAPAPAAVSAAPPPLDAQPPRNLDEGDDLADELNRELDRLFGLDDSSFDDSEAMGAAETPSAPVPQPEPAPEQEEAPLDSIEEINLEDLGLGGLDLSEGTVDELPDDLDLSDLDLSDLDLDLSLDDESMPVAQAGGQEVEEVLDFSGLEDALTGEGLESSGAEEELDFSDLGLEPETGSSAAPPVFDDDLDFSDLEAALEAPAASGEPEEDLDFSDLALSLDDGLSDVELVGDSQEVTLSRDNREIEPLSLGGGGELELSLDDGPSGTALGRAGSVGGGGLPQDDDGLMELDLELDLGVDEPMQAALDSSLDEELDLSELEGLLQEEPSSELTVAEDDDIELELDFDFQADEKTQEIEPLSTAPLGESDFSDIEAMLEKDDKPLDVVSDLSGEIDLELELDLAPAMEETVVSTPLMAQAEPVMGMAEIDEDEMISDASQSASSKAKASHTFAADGGRGSGLRIFVTIFLVVIFLFAILAGVYALRGKIRDRTGIAIPTIAVVETVREQVASFGIPGVSDWVKPEVKDPDGKLNLATQDVTGRFMTSPILGDLFVITGKVRNNYRETHHSIRLMGRLFTKDNHEAQGKEFFAGNIITDAELGTLTLDQVDQRLKTASGNENINARVRPGQLVPFMVIFEKLPDDLAEFAVEILASGEGVAIP